jgi:hypothetical protein
MAPPFAAPNKGMNGRLPLSAALGNTCARES